jgi:MSHA pilin protein MshC
MQEKIQANNRHCGFTIIELVMVMVILGVLSAYLLPRWTTIDTTVHAQGDRMARDLRHAQAMAMNQGRTLTVQLPSNSDYRVTDQAVSPGTPVTDPADVQTPFAYTFQDNVTRAGSCGDIDFDSLGRPLSGGTLLAASCDYILTGGTVQSTLSVTPLTGHITVTP